MGLDMYLQRTKRVNGLSIRDYLEFDNAVYNFKEYTPDRQDLKELMSEVYTSSYGWNTIFSDMGYWRKANQIHSWFVNNVQERNDDCGTYEVTKEKVEELLSIVNSIVKPKEEPDDLISEYNVLVSQEFDLELAQSLLPTQSGFFFGNTDYNQGYYDDLILTKNILENVLSTTDFDKQIIFYNSSW